MDSTTARGARQLLESLARAGVTSLPKCMAIASAPAATMLPASQPASEKSAAEAPRTPTSAPPLTAARALLLGDSRESEAILAAERPAALQVIATEVAGC